MDDTLRAALAAAAELEKLGVRWFLGGSLASSIHGKLDLELLRGSAAELGVTDLLEKALAA